MLIGDGARARDDNCVNGAIKATVIEWFSDAHQRVLYAPGFSGRLSRPTFSPSRFQR